MKMPKVLDEVMKIFFIRNNHQYLTSIGLDYKNWEDCGRELFTRIDGCKVVSVTCSTCVNDKVWE